MCVTNIQGADHSSWNKYNNLAVHEFLANEGETYFFLLAGEKEETVGEYKLKVTDHV